ncbi:MAG TPA: serine hydrolase domain-containing protein [Vicinamibacterales bacterium]|nr:serine hydrolase domain-containing protein [Vicinamibacterales bacterium]
MRRLPGIFLIVGMLQLVPGPAPGDWVLSLFEDYLEALRRQAGIPGLAAVIAGDNGIVWERGFGKPDLDLPQPVTGDTPFHADGLMQIVTATLVLRCVEQGRLTLDDPVVPVDPSNPIDVPTIRQVLTHTSGSPDAPIYFYQPERYEALRPVVETCTGGGFREAVARLLEDAGMTESVPGEDVLFLPPPPADPLDPGLHARYTETMTRYAAILSRLATPYAVDPRGNATRSQYLLPTLTAWGGLVSTARDLARFDIALRSGSLVRPETLAAVWQTSVGSSPQPLPHGLGWFTSIYNGRAVAWQFGVTDGASSSLIVSVPAQRMTMVLLANSDGLVRPFPLNNGDITVSPFGRVLVGLFVP